MTEADIAALKSDLNATSQKAVQNRQPERGNIARRGAGARVAVASRGRKRHCPRWSFDTW